MSNDKEDLELEALQRQLDDAFATTRPRRGFEDELWLRMQSKRPIWTRLRDALGPLGLLFREAPAVPLGGIAVVLVVVIGASIVINSGLRLGGSHNSYAAQAPAGLSLGDAAYGRLPSPELHPGLIDQGVPNAAAAAPLPEGSKTFANQYFGPANLRWTGQLPVELPATGLVYRYSEPGASVIDPFVQSLGAKATQPTAPGFAGTYAGQGFTVSVRGTVPQLPREPYFVLTSANGAGATGSDPQTVAMNFLAFYGLFPTWDGSQGVVKSGGSQVVFVRLFQLAPNIPLAETVDWTGEPYGIEVDLAGGQVRTASGPLPLSLDSINYRLISNAQAVRVAVASGPTSTQGIQPVPTVNLDTAQLVYALAVSNGQGFYEPAYLFSGTFSYNGQTYTKRVLVPLVDPSLRS